jgi:hypothetical protein
MNNVYEGLNAYKTYLAIRNHFNSSYDYFKYNGKVKVSNDSFLKRRDKFFFAKIERKYRGQELVYFFVANFLSDDQSWSGSLVGSESEKNYVEWRKRIESLKYNFRLECESIYNEIESQDISFDDYFKVVDANHPRLLRKYLGKHLSLETFTIMDGILNFTKQWNSELKDDIMYCTVREKSNKYNPFLQVDLQAYKKVMRSVFS